MIVQALLPKVEARLRDKCDKIDAFAMGQEDGKSPIQLGE